MGKVQNPITFCLAPLAVCKDDFIFLKLTLCLPTKDKQFLPKTETLAPESSKPIKMSSKTFTFAKGRSSDPCIMVDSKSFLK